MASILLQPIGEFCNRSRNGCTKVFRPKNYTTGFGTDKENDCGSLDGISSVKIAEKVRLFLKRYNCVSSPNVPSISPILAEITIVSRNCINYCDVTEHDLGQLFEDVPPPVFPSAGGFGYT